MSQKDEWLDEKDRRESMRSLFYFAKFILGYDLEKKPHLEFCDWVQEEATKTSLTLMPRGTFKTTIISQALPIWLAIRNPNARILLYSEVLKQSMRNLEVIKHTLVRNQRLRFLFGDLAGADDGNQYSLTVKTRSNYRLKEPTFGTGSIDTVDVGTHWTHIIVDDVQSDSNSQTRQQIDSVYDNWRLLFSLLDPGCHMRVVGTRWADMDLYGRIKENHPEIKVYEKAAILPDGELLFPARLTREFLDDIKKTQGSAIFYSQYMNDPLPKDDNQSFRGENFMYGQHNDCPLAMVVDPAISQGDRADSTAIVIGGLSANNELFIDHYEAGKFDPFVTIEKMFGYLDRYGPRIRTVGIEEVAFQRMLKFAFEKEMKKRGRFVNVQGLKHTQKKVDRILSLQPMYAAKAVYHKLWMKGAALEDELLRFPKGRHDDIIDAAAGLLEVLRPHGKGYGPSRARQVREATAREKVKKLEHDSHTSLEGKIRYELEKNRSGWDKKKMHNHPMLGPL